MIHIKIRTLSTNYNKQKNPVSLAIHIGYNGPGFPMVICEQASHFGTLHLDTVRCEIYESCKYGFKYCWR